MNELRRGSVVWVQPDATVGREQTGRRPMVIVASAEYLHIMRDLAIAVPVTLSDRGWPNHVRVDGTTSVRGFAMTEQVRAIARERIIKVDGAVSQSSLAAVDSWLRDFLALTP